MNQLLSFYYGSHPDHRGRMLAEIVQQDDDGIEQAHDFIQWLFLSEIFEENCKKGIMPKTETEKVCQQYRLEIEGLQWTRTKYIGEMFGVIFAAAVGASLLWALLAWIGRGFKKDR